jgi:hypothetical protein
MKLMTSMTGAAFSAVLAVTVPVLVAVPAAASTGSVTPDGAASVTAITAARGQRPTPARPARPASTEIVLTVTPSTGPAYQSVMLVVVVTADKAGIVGAVTIRDRSVVIASGVALDHGAASITTNALGPGQHVLTAELAATAACAGSTSAPVIASYGDGDGPVGASAQTVVVTIPAGSLTITTPYSVDRSLDLGSADLDQTTSTYAAGARIDDIVITDTRAGNQGFTASVTSSRFVNANGDSFAGGRAGLVDVAADQVPGNALLASDVRVFDTTPGAPGLARPRVFARYPAGRSLGAVHVHGTLAVTGVPSSVRAGRYLATLTFTIL